MRSAWRFSRLRRSRSLVRNLGVNRLLKTPRMSRRQGEKHRKSAVYRCTPEHFGALFNVVSRRLRLFQQPIKSMGTSLGRGTTESADPRPRNEAVDFNANVV